jgi:DNA recombination protein RmuC
MLSVVGSFRQQYDKFSEALDKVGRQLDSTRKAFDDLSGTRRRQLERPLAKLDEIRTQRGIETDVGLLPDADVHELGAARDELGA